MKAIEAAIERLSKCHPEHISQYGTGNEERLTGARSLPLHIACRLGGCAGCRQHSHSLPALLAAPPGLPAPHPSCPSSNHPAYTTIHQLPCPSPQASTRRATSTPSATAWPTAARPSASRCRCSWRARCARAGGLVLAAEHGCWLARMRAGGLLPPCALHFCQPGSSPANHRRPRHPRSLSLVVFNCCPPAAGLPGGPPPRCQRGPLHCGPPAHQEHQ